MFSLICAGTNGWVNNGEAGDLRSHHALYDIIVMQSPQVYGHMVLIITISLCQGWKLSSSYTTGVNIAMNNIDFHVIESRLSGHYDVISNWLWRHQQYENRASETLGRCVKIFIFVMIYGFIMSCMCYFSVYFPCCFATLKQFVTWVHTLFSKYHEIQRISALDVLMKPHPRPANYHQKLVITTSPWEHRCQLGTIQLYNPSYEAISNQMKGLWWLIPSVIQKKNKNNFGERYW